MLLLGLFPRACRCHNGGQHTSPGEQGVVHAQHIGGMDAGVVRVAGVALLDAEQEPAAGRCGVKTEISLTEAEFIDCSVVFP